MLSPEVSDVDGNIETRRGTISVFNGPTPDVVVLDTVEEEIDTVADWLTRLSKDGMLPHEIGIFVRSSAQLDRTCDAAQKSGLPFSVLDKKMAVEHNNIAISTMHLAKGLEFRAVAVMACDDEIIPSQERMESVADDADLKEIYNNERHLLYVACTRARDRLLVTSVDPASEFLDDLTAGKDKN